MTKAMIKIGGGVEIEAHLVSMTIGKPPEPEIEVLLPGEHASNCDCHDCMVDSRCTVFWIDEP